MTRCRFVPARLFLSLTIAACLLTGARQPSAPSIQVSVIDGDTALNSLQTRGAKEPVVRVTDRSGKSLAGVYVEFDTPKAGPGALFPGGSTHFATTTSQDGVAKATGLQNNGVAGGFTILIHASYQGFPGVELSIRQTNVRADLAGMANGMQPDARIAISGLALPNTVLGVAFGDQFLLNGAITPNNANLLPGQRIQTEATPTTIYMHDNCEFLIGPHSSVIIQPQTVSVLDGAVRAKHFGSCRLSFNGLWITSPETDGDAVLALSPDHMEVGSVTGPLEIQNALGVIGTVQQGTVSSLAYSRSADTGAVVATPQLTPKVAYILGAGVGASLVGLGVAVDAAVQTPSTSP